MGPLTPHGMGSPLQAFYTCAARLVVSWEQHSWLCHDQLCDLNVVT